MSETKMTKSEIFAGMRDYFNGVGETDYAEFCQHEIDALAAKAEKAKERAAKKRAEGDDLKAAVASALTDEFQTGAAIFAAVDGGDEDWATLGKVRARLTALVKDGTAVKDEVKVTEGEKTKTVMGYRLA